MNKSTKSAADEFDEIGELDLENELLVKSTKKKSKSNKKEKKNKKVELKDEIECIVFDDSKDALDGDQNDGELNILNKESNKKNQSNAKLPIDKVELKATKQIKKSKENFNDNLIEEEGDDLKEEETKVDEKKELDNKSDDEQIEDSEQEEKSTPKKTTPKSKQEQQNLNKLNDESPIRTSTRSKRELPAKKAKSIESPVESSNKRSKRSCTLKNDPLQYIKTPVNTPLIGLKLGLSRRASIKQPLHPELSDNQN